MTSEEYWNGHPYLASAFMKKHELDMDEANEMLWLQGFYNCIAHETALSNFHMDGKQHKHNDYISKPFELRPKEKDEEKERQKAQDIVVGQLDALFISFNKNKDEVKADAGDNRQTTN